MLATRIILPDSASRLVHAIDVPLASLTSSSHKQREALRAEPMMPAVGSLRGATVQRRNRTCGKVPPDGIKERVNKKPAFR